VWIVRVCANFDRECGDGRYETRFSLERTLALSQMSLPAFFHLIIVATASPTIASDLAKFEFNKNGEQEELRTRSDVIFHV
jgi:hypothetical protein